MRVVSSATEWSVTYTSDFVHLSMTSSPCTERIDAQVESVTPRMMLARFLALSAICVVSATNAAGTKFLSAR